MSPPWMPLYIADYRADTAHLGAAEHGAYLLLIMHYWSKGVLPQDDRLLARIACMTPEEWAEARPVIADLFGPGWTHKRIDAELAHADEVISKRRAAAHARYSKSNANAPAYAGPKNCKSMPDAPYAGVPPSPSPVEDISLPSEARPSAEQDECGDALEAYNAAARSAGWPVAQRLTAARRGQLRKRLSECGGIDGWRAAMAKARGSPFLCGDNDRGWLPDFDFFLQAKSFTKLMEGAYDRPVRPASGQREPNRSASQSQRGRTIMAEILSGRPDSRLSAAHPGANGPIAPTEGGRGGDVLPFGEPTRACIIR